MDVTNFSILGQIINIKDPTAREEAENAINTANTALSSIPVRYTNHYRDVVNGNTYTHTDTSETVSTGTHTGGAADPYESMDYFFEMLNRGKTDIRCYIDTPGYYVIHKPVITNAVVHITCRVAGVHLVFNDSSVENVAFYNSHWNIQCTTGACELSTKLGSMLYWENCATLLSNVVCNQRLQTYGGYFIATGLHYLQFYCDGTQVVLQNAICTNKVTSNVGLVIRRSSILRLYGTTTDFNGLPSAGTDNAMISVEGSICIIESAQNYLGTNYYNGIRAVDSIVVCTKARWNTYDNASVNGNVNENSLIIQGAATVGA